MVAPVASTPGVRSRRPAQRFDTAEDEPATPGERLQIAELAIQACFAATAERARGLALTALGDGRLLAEPGPLPLLAFKAPIALLFADALEEATRVFGQTPRRRTARGLADGVLAGLAPARRGVAEARRARRGGGGRRERAALPEPAAAPRAADARRDPAPRGRRRGRGGGLGGIGSGRRSRQQPRRGDHAPDTRATARRTRAGSSRRWPTSSAAASSRRPGASGRRRSRPGAATRHGCWPGSAGRRRPTLSPARRSSGAGPSAPRASSVPHSEQPPPRPSSATQAWSSCRRPSSCSAESPARLDDALARYELGAELRRAGHRAARARATDGGP